MVLMRPAKKRKGFNPFLDIFFNYANFLNKYGGINQWKAFPLKIFIKKVINLQRDVT